jgi:SAM-dependent methyltransferase
VEGLIIVPGKGSFVDTKPAAAEPSIFDDGELYDLLCKDLTYAIDFYVGLAREAKGPVLEVACGTGRILLPCLQAGADVDGLDLSEGMLSTLRKKAAALNLAPRLYTADMSDFQLPRRYALIMITFNAFVHNVTQEAQIRCLELCRQHLAPGGLLAFDGSFPGLGIIGAADNTRVLELETRHPETGLPLRCYDTRSFDRVEQIQRSVNEIEVLEADGKVKTVHRSELRTRWTYKAEMALLLRVAGFARWEIFGDFDRRPLTRETDDMIVLAWRDGEG